ncbi:MAG: SAM-dependent DNA methyltransferase [Candidatus Hydrogenedentes bacterium]|nr:SAM-dependent DNA methyltransferase [Candidatus Hydrogenedentota bacterium]
MASLERTLRRQLENTVKQARRVAEAGGRKAIEQLAVHHHEPWSSMSLEQRQLRNRLRAHGRQLGDRRDERRGTQTIERLVGECAYEHWHRMLFARFLAENDLLIEPETGVPITLAECQELARDKNQDWLELASSYAVRMLQEIFRPDDPVLQVNLPPETVSVLEDLLKGLPCEVFTAGDSLGWCYQFWQAERKDEVNASGNKIGADELPAVTQLFTEDYMVDFLLDNTLGAWYAGKVLAENPELAANAKDEDELRNAVALPGCPWKYLRFVKVAEASSICNQRQDAATTIEQPAYIRNQRQDAAATMGKTSSPSKQESIVAEASSLCNQSQDGSATIWRPAAGTFDGWPKTAKLLTCLDPCMGSGHFEVAMFERLVALRMAEEGMDEATAVAAVIRDNLFGLEIDPRCTQIAAFNLALAAWRRVGYRPLPPMNLACSGLAPNTRESDWLAVVGDNEKLQNGMVRLYGLFQKAAVLGSLINPRLNTEDMYIADYHELQPLLEEVLEQETKDDTSHEMAVTAQGLAKAAEILAGQYTLVATNVPYLARGKQESELREFAEKHYTEAKQDLATIFLARCLEFVKDGGRNFQFRESGAGCFGHYGAIASVTPHNWLFLTSYKQLREKLLKEKTFDVIARLGPCAFETISGQVVNVALCILSNTTPETEHALMGLDVSEARRPEEKALGLGFKIWLSEQGAQLQNPDARVVFESAEGQELLSEYSGAYQGVSPADYPHYGRAFWETNMDKECVRWQASVERPLHYGGRHQILWKNVDFMFAVEQGYAYWRGNDSIGKNGVVVSAMRELPVTFSEGHPNDTNVAIIVPQNQSHLPAIWCFCSSPDYAQAVRRIDQALKVTNASLVKVPFDLDHWQRVAAEQYPHGLPEPYSDDPTQWLFHGHPCDSVRWNEATKRLEVASEPRVDATVLQVAVARLLGYHWPAEKEVTGTYSSANPAQDAPATMCLSMESRELVARCEALYSFADDDGIVCLHPVNREQPAASRLRTLLATAFGDAWSAGKERELLAAVGMKKGSLEDWLSDGFFEQHCALFHQRPFIWHIWDGRQDGFNALVNYHKLADSGRGFQPLESATVDAVSSQEADHSGGGFQPLESAAGCRCHYEGTHTGRRILEKLIYTYLGDWITRQRQDQQQGVEGADARLAAALHLQNELKKILEGEPPYDIFVRWKPLHEQAIGWDPDINDGVRMNIRPFMTARPLNAKAKNASILRVTPRIKWTKDRGKEPTRPIEDYPWFWGWDEKTQDFPGSKTFDGNRWNDLHYTNAHKQSARTRRGGLR